MNDAAPLRRTPKQSRSQQRVDHVLDTAAAIFGEMGYENATTNAIAAQAGRSIGSLYQFFPNKEALLEALVARYIAAWRSKITSTMTPEAGAGLPMYVAIERMVSAIGIFEQTHAGFKMIFMNTHAEAAHALHLEILDAVERTLAERFPTLPDAERRLGTMTLVSIVKGLMGLADAPNNVNAQVMEREMLAALVAYLRVLLVRNGIELPADLR